MKPCTLLLPLALASMTLAIPQPAQACTALIGHYATRPAGPALLQTARHPEGFLLLERQQASQPWQIHPEPLAALSGFTLQSRIFPDMPLDSCALIAGNGTARLFIATRPGLTYPVNSIGQREAATHINPSGFFIHQTSETGSHGQDLYRVAHTGPAPVLPRQRAKLSGLPHMILPTAAICPGNQPPTLRQAQWQGLPEPVRLWFGRSDATTLQDVLCGQWLYSTLMATRQDTDTLHRQTALLDVGQTPLNWQGQSAWWQIARHLLLQRLRFGQPPHTPPKAVPLSDHFALLQDVILPRLARQWQEGDTSQREAMLTLSDILSHGDALTLPALRVLDALGVLQWEVAMSAPKAAPGLPLARTVLQRAMLPDVSLAVFGFLLQRSGTPDANVLQALIERGSVEKLAHGLQHGLDPSQWDALGLARELGRHDMAALLSEVLRQHGYALPAN